MLSMLVIFSADEFLKFFSFFSENRLHEMSKPVKKIVNLLLAEIAQSVGKV